MSDVVCIDDGTPWEAPPVTAERAAERRADWAAQLRWLAQEVEAGNIKAVQLAALTTGQVTILRDGAVEGCLHYEAVGLVELLKKKVLGNA